MLVDTLALISVVAMILILRPFVEILPSLLACLIRWKEIVNLENVVKYARYRNWIAFILIIPFCITVYEFKLYRPHFIENLSDDLNLLAIIGVFIGYLVLRLISSNLSMSRKKRTKASDTAQSSSYIFFIILTLLSMIEGAILSFIKVDIETIRSIILWTCGIIYVIALVRKLQILSSNYNLFSAILYLCAFEILPTGALLTSAIIF